MAEKKLTRHAAHTRLDISRPSMDKIWDGKNVELEIIERFALKLNQDVNEWRVMWGFAPVGSLTDLADLAYGRLMRRFGADTRKRLIIEAHYERITGQIKAGDADAANVVTFEEEAEAEIGQLPTEGTPLEQLGYAEVEEPLARIRTAARTLTYDPDLEGVGVAGYRGGQDVPPEDVKTLDTLYRAFLTEQRRKQGRD